LVGIDMTVDVVIVMGSQSDWSILKHAKELLDKFNIPCEVKIVSAHRTPDRLYQFAKDIASSGVKVIIAGAGGAAHLPGMIAAMTDIPVLGVPVQSSSLLGIDSLLSIVQMPAGIPVGTLAIGEPGAKNAAILAASILALNDKRIKKVLQAFRKTQTQNVADSPAS
jgi:5-(carboxyamino)imidazole ribonucleotide mutase